MVDVGNKTPTRRIAKARCTVTFPPEVLSAFSTQPQNKDMIGPKGPIFETARLAGIMGAKKTSDLIPLCHPLPLDRVHVEIELVGNQAIVECECWVTHKTGVEMEVSYLIVIECIYNDYL
jgi:cyclic pyranopterin phosphate synthase